MYTGERDEASTSIYKENLNSNKGIINWKIQR